MTPSCPQYGPNTKGFCKDIDGKTTFITVEHSCFGGILHCKTSTGQHITVHQSNFIMLPVIPSHLREYHFTSLAKIWATALRNFPHASVFKPSTMSPATLQRKLRESRVAKNKYGWQHPLIDDDQWKQHADAIAISTNDSGEVVLSGESNKVVETTEIVAKNQVVVQWKDKSTLEHFCALCSSKSLSPAPTFLITNLTTDLITDLEARYDVGFTPLDDGLRWEVIY